MFGEEPLEGCGRAEGRPGPKQASVLHHTQAHMLRRHASAERGGACPCSAPQAHFTELRNRPLPAAREGHRIIDLVLLPARVEVMD